jgi:hypothetical protein
VSVDHANMLESRFSGLPTLVQETLHTPFNWRNESLKAVSGDPQALVAGGEQYLRLANAVSQVAQEQMRDAGALAGRWQGDAYDAFNAHIYRIKYADLANHRTGTTPTTRHACSP